jgi:hypothetical protein
VRLQGPARLSAALGRQVKFEITSRRVVLRLAPVTLALRKRFLVRKEALLLLAPERGAQVA